MELLIIRSLAREEYLLLYYFCAISNANSRSDFQHSYPLCSNQVVPAQGNSPNSRQQNVSPASSSKRETLNFKS